MSFWPRCIFARRVDKDEMPQAKDLRAEDKNKHIREFISHYINLKHRPYYAVLLNGAWGIGKTFLIKSILQENCEDEKSFAYVSLYGISEIDELDSALFQALYPALGWKVTKVAGRVAKSVLKFYGADTGTSMEEFLTKSSDKLYVFDDLERCDAPINKVLGYINELVEHDGCKVIILANQKEILDKDTYTRVREKLIGKTLEVLSTFDQAFAYFKTNISSNSARKLIEENAEVISEIYGQSELNNLRILQQAMWEFERFVEALSEKHLGNNDAMRVAMQVFFSFVFEFRAGRIGESELLSRQQKLVLEEMSRKKDEPLSPLSAMAERYKFVNIGSTIITDETLVEILVKGLINPRSIRSGLESSGFFSDALAESAWRAVWHSFERTEEELEKSLAVMERQFASREFKVTGEILHVFGLRIWLSKIGVLKKTNAEIVSEGKSYVDDMVKSDSLEPLRPNASEEFHFSGFGGLGIQQTDTAEYRELFEYLKAARLVVEKNSYPRLGAKLLEEMRDNSELFSRRINWTENEDGKYYRVPVLAAIHPEKFLNQFLALHPRDQITVLRALNSRYENNVLKNDLADEVPWLEEFQNRLLAETAKMKPLSRYRLERSVSSGIGKALSMAKEQPAAAS